jgi:DNA-binding MarR family transcriptional regulator
VFDNFWNGWAVDQNLVVVICGSSASWMIDQVINDKGGLHNRVTQRIHLKPFTLGETEQFFQMQGIQMPRYSIVQLYMAIGGIPFYLREVQKGESAVQALDRMFFGKGAPFAGEFDNLYRALFSNYQKHIEVIRALASKWKGLTRQELIDSTSMQTGGAMSSILKELETSDFIQSYQPFAKKERDKLYRLTDEYSLFFLRFIEPQAHQKGFWLKNFNTLTAIAWSGYAFESLCMKHIEGIKQGLGISGISTRESSFVKRKDSTSDGCQIDMLIERADKAINICEMKFYDGPYMLDTQELRNLQQKRNVFQKTTETKKQLFITLIAAQGLYQNEYAYIADKVLDMNTLF